MEYTVKLLEKQNEGKNSKLNHFGQEPYKVFIRYRYINSYKILEFKILSVLVCRIEFDKCKDKRTH